jgi:hypothetical protein
VLLYYILEHKTIFGNLLNVVNTIKSKCTLNTLPLPILLAKDKYLSGYNMKNRDKGARSSDDKENSSSREVERGKTKCRKYDL